MTITAKVIADSVSPRSIRLTTMQLRYPKFIHGEFMTHRVFSRNASSSRAIPVERLIQDVMDDPAMPVFWGSNKPGMQAGEELPRHERRVAIEEWLWARAIAVEQARKIAKLGVHKQIINRIIEPWCHINVVVTATNWTNFFALRRHPDAQPEMRALADAIYAAREASTPTFMNSWQWHLPYVDRLDETHELTVVDPLVCIKLSVARCARVSYLTHEGKAPNIEDDLKLYDRLVGATPLHASPAEHQATPDLTGDLPTPFSWQKPWLHGNFIGWIQYRKTLHNETVTDRDYEPS